MRTLHRTFGILSASAVIAGTCMAVAQPANAESSQDAAQTAALESPEYQEVEYEEDSLAYEVDNANSFDEAAAILEQNGFTQVADAGDDNEIVYEKTVDGVSLAFNLGDPDAMQPMWGTGWNWGNGGPYVKATAPQWQSAIAQGSIVSIAACTFITATVGAAACATAIGLASYHISQIDTSNWPSNMCIAVAPGTSNTWVEAC